MTKQTTSYAPAMLCALDYNALHISNLFPLEYAELHHKPADRPL
jgi:hypothetical protein